MKSFGTYNPPELVGLEFIRLATPHGREMPRSPVIGELFTMEFDPPQPQNNAPWYLKGTYVFNGTSWVRLSDGLRRRISQPIGSQKLEIEEGFDFEQPLTSTTGEALASICVQPSTQVSYMSGSASMWVDMTASGYVSLTVFRDEVLVSRTLDYIDAGKPRTISTTFTDIPLSKKPQTYSLRIMTDVVGFLYVNQCAKFKFDGSSHTAFTVEENV